MVSGAGPEGIAETAATYLSPPVVLSTTTGVMARHQAEARATAAPSATAAPAPPEASSAPDAAAVLAPFSTYTIQPGDSVSSIGESFGLDSNYIVWNNPGIRDDPDYLLVGANILIPSVNGLVYTVTLGDTLSDIAAYYQVDVQTITAFAPNKLTSPDAVIEGMVLVLPGAVPPPPAPASAPAPAPVTVDDPEPLDDSPPVYAAADPGPHSSSGFIWPFHGAISQYFSSAHRGIDIDGFGAYGAPISAAADGVVVLAAYQDWGYGYHVIIEHADGSRTLYGHLSDIWVAQGQYVSQGEAVGALGTTGYSTGPHLHFEIHIGGPVDPLAYLP